MEPTPLFLSHLAAALADATLVKLTLSKPRPAAGDWHNVYARLAEIKGQPMLTCTLRFATRDETRNLPLPDAPAQVGAWLEGAFRNADLFTTTTQYSLQLSKKGKGLLRQSPYQGEAPASLAHDHTKQRPLSQATGQWLHDLGIAGPNGQVLQQGQRKFKQINKYIELIGHLLDAHPLPQGGRIVDMGSGKGYLTFALYDYLTHVLRHPVRMTGVELRPGLVDQCNGIAQKYAFDALTFVAEDIHTYHPDGGIDMLIALHACDTATDEAIAKGISAQASIIVVAPCCHKQVRRDMASPAALLPVLKHGILLERQAELLTDGLRALYLERHGYRTKVFEFVGTEHTPKNVMITAVRATPRPEVQAEIDALKTQFGLRRHYLEEILGAPPNSP